MERSGKIMLHFYVFLCSQNRIFFKSRKHFHRKGELFDVNKQFSIICGAGIFEKYKGNNSNDSTRLSEENWTLHTFSQKRRNI